MIIIGLLLLLCPAAVVCYLYRNSIFVPVLLLSLFLSYSEAIGAKFHWKAGWTRPSQIPVIFHSTEWIPRYESLNEYTQESTCSFRALRKFIRVYAKICRIFFFFPFSRHTLNSGEFGVSISGIFDSSRNSVHLPREVEKQLFRQ